MLHSAEGASPPHSHRTARPRAPPPRPRRWASCATGMTRSRASASRTHRRVRAYVRAYVHACLSCVWGVGALARAVCPELNETDEEREEGPATSGLDEVTAGAVALPTGTSDCKQGSPRGLQGAGPSSRPPGQKATSSLRTAVQAAGSPPCPTVPGKGHKAGHQQCQHGARGTLPSTYLAERSLHLPEEEILGRSEILWLSLCLGHPPHPGT